MAIKKISKEEHDKLTDDQKKTAIKLSDTEYVIEDSSTLEEALRKAREETGTEKAARIAAEKEKERLEKEQREANSGLSADKIAEFRKKEVEPLTTKITDLETKLADRDKRENYDQALERLVDDPANGIHKDRRALALLVLKSRTELDKAGTGIIVKDKEGKATTIPIASFVKDKLREEPEHTVLYEGSDTQGSGGSSSSSSSAGLPILGIEATKTASEAATKFNDARAAIPNPLLSAVGLSSTPAKK